jgi:hypothetical protein
MLVLTGSAGLVPVPVPKSTCTLPRPRSSCSYKWIVALPVIEPACCPHHEDSVIGRGDGEGEGGRDTFRGVMR